MASVRVAFVAAFVSSSVSRLCLAQAPAPAPADAVSRVVQLLTELQARVQQDAAQEQATFDKYACWCEKSTAKKALAITAARDQIDKIGNSILQLKGEVATTIAEIKELMSDILKNEKAQAETTAVREKENAAYAAESNEISETLSALEKAVTILRAATGGSASAKKTALAATKTATALVTVSTATAHLNGNARAKVEQGVAVLGSAHYQPQSETIQGILTDMYSTFSTTLETLTHTEANRHRTFEELIASYQAELKTMQETIVKKEHSKAEAETMLAEATQGYADLEIQIKADVEYFDATKASCSSKGKEWRDRKELRAEEVSGIEKALEILSSDEAKALFANTTKPGFQTAFLQIDASDVRPAPVAARLAGAYQQLRAHAMKSHSLRLAALAATVQGGVGHFDKVLEAIDTMTATLQEEEQTDIKRADECGVQMQNIASEKAALGWKIEKNVAKIDKLGKIKGEKENDRNSTVENIGTVEKDITDMTAQRTADNAEFKQGKSNDEKAIKLLRQATTALVQYYNSNGMKVNGTSTGRQGASLLARNGSDALSAEPPDARMSGKGNRKGEAKGIVAMLEMITEDLEAEISSSIKNEAASQLDYESRLATAKALKEGLEKRRDNIDTALAENKKKTLDESGLQSENEGQLETQKETETDLKPSCDWIKENIAPRRTKRATEMDGLRQAREYLAGMGAPSLTQRRVLVHRHVQ